MEHPSKVLISKERAAYKSTSPKMTGDIAREFGETLKPGDLVFLFGDIGSGKTVFVNGMAKALGISGPLPSPTFTIANEHRGNDGVVLYHFDAYRLDSSEELSDAGFYDYPGGNGIVALEWAERLGGDLPNNRIEVWITKDSSSPGIFDASKELCDSDAFVTENIRFIRIMDYYYAPFSS